MDTPQTRRPWPALRVLLILGRISNCPTVWSNCLAAWWVEGGTAWKRFAVLCGGTTLLYTGGMFLNDVCDVDFDRRYRPERPIPSGDISRGAVSVLSLALLLSGWLMLLPLGAAPAVFGGVLLAAIVLYDFVHKRSSFGPLLMSLCRFLVYLLAAASTEHGPGLPVFWRALALGAYISGLSYLARGEAAPRSAGAWSYGLLLAPIVLALAASGTGAPVLLPAGALGLLLIWCLPGRRVSGLLAGIALVDWVAAAHSRPEMGAVFIALFLLALMLQRSVPAT
ncbi:MAG: UbiA family prenyltransferase [Limisphaerales bacterium]